MALPGLEQLALVPTGSKIPWEVREALNRIFEREQPSTAEAARVPARGDWDAVPESERQAYRLFSASYHFMNPPTLFLNQIDEGLRHHGITLPPMQRLLLGEWLQGYFVDVKHHLHSTLHSRAHTEAYMTFWNDYLVPLAGQPPAPILAAFAFEDDDFGALRAAVKALEPDSA